VKSSLKKFILGNYLIRLNTIDSTNNFAARFVEEDKIAEGTVILAENQTNGRGQGKNIWESEPGKNLTFSFIIFPGFLEASNQFYLSMIISNSIIDLLSMYGLNAKIKWPNDIYFEDKKIAGILIENRINNSNIKSCIAGLGINVNQLFFNTINPKPTSIAMETGKTIPLEEIFNKLLKILNDWIEKLYKHEFPLIRLAYLNNIRDINNWLTYTDAHESFEGRIVDVLDSGELIINKRNGVTVSYSHGEIS